MSIHIIGGGTTYTVRPHLQLAAKAYGTTARELQWLCRAAWDGKQSVEMHLTKMATGGQGILETNNDIKILLDDLIAAQSVKIIFMLVALCDWTAEVFDGISTKSGQDQPRLKTSDGVQELKLYPANKLISNIRKNRKDIFLVGFKTTAGETPDNQYFAGLNLLKKSSCNLVLANDVHTRLNMVITPEQARYYESTDRAEVLRGLVEMTYFRSNLHFTRSTVVSGDPIPWDSQLVPNSLRAVVDYCIAQGAYKPFLGSTVGHFAVKIDEGKFLTSRRKTDFNKLNETGLVLVETVGDDSVIAHGSRPSVGGQSQRIVFKEHPDTDCIVHAHVPLRAGSQVPLRSQKEFECGSHECGQNTSSGLKKFGNLYAVMLDKHGPNIVFNKNINPNEVINFINDNFDLSGRTDMCA